MSNLRSGLFPQQLVVPAQARGPQRLLGEFPTYAGAEHLVDQLSDKGFAVEHCRIVGTGLRSVEYVTGRLTRAQAALAGASTGAWFGLLIGLLLGMFSDPSSWLAVVVVSTGLGAAWMAALGFIAHWATRGRRDFAAVQSLEADSYAVHVDADHADEAVRAASLF